MSDERNNNPDSKSETPASKPDPATLHTTDPQKKMEGPVSSLMHNTGEAFTDDTTEQEANEERNKAL